MDERDHADFERMAAEIAGHMHGAVARFCDQHQVTAGAVSGAQLSAAVRVAAVHIDPGPLAEWLRALADALERAGGVASTVTVPPLLFMSPGGEA